MTAPFDNATAALLADLRSMSTGVVRRTHDGPEPAHRWEPPPRPERPTRPHATCTRAEWHAYRLAEHTYRTRGGAA